ncbi:hypothetical protein V8J88_19725 [Massilia sp. W12]|uniref:hypothetical protein n=1 Tax=Massilia sp. W12 TaxID=3126507 RepID=UPI0030CB2827
MEFAALDEYLRLRHTRWRRTHDDTVAWVGPENIQTHDGRILPAPRRQSTLPPDARLFHAGDILLSRASAAFLGGACGIVDLQAQLALAGSASLPAIGACSPQILVLQGQSEQDLTYFCHWLRWRGRLALAQLIREHGARPRVPRSALAHCWLALPGPGLRQIFASYLTLQSARICLPLHGAAARSLAAQAFCAQAWERWEQDLLALARP